jgi:hypothetical protein
VTPSRPGLAVTIDIANPQQICARTAKVITKLEPFESFGAPPKATDYLPPCSPLVEASSSGSFSGFSGVGQEPSGAHATLATAWGDAERLGRARPRRLAELVRTGHEWQLWPSRRDESRGNDHGWQRGHPLGRCFGYIS